MSSLNCVLSACHVSESLALSEVEWVETSLAVDSRMEAQKELEIWFAHFPLAQSPAFPSMSRLPQPLHSRLRCAALGM